MIKACSHASNYVGPVCNSCLIAPPCTSSTTTSLGHALMKLPCAITTATTALCIFFVPRVVYQKEGERCRACKHYATIYGYLGPSKHVLPFGFATAELICQLIEIDPVSKIAEVSYCEACAESCRTVTAPKCRLHTVVKAVALDLLMEDVTHVHLSVHLSV